MKRSSTRARWLVPAVGLLTAVAACGSDSTSSGGAAASGGGGGQKATGTPINIGFVNQEDTPAGSFPEVRLAAEAAAQYLNNEKNGIGGHPINLITCKTNGQGTSNQQCAQKMVDQKVALVSGGIDFGWAAGLPVLAAANIPLVGVIPLLTPELTSPDSFTFIGGSAAAFPDQDLYIAKTLNLKKVRIIYTDNDAGKAAADGFGKQILNAYGVGDVKLIPEKADATDFTPSLSAALSDKPDAIMVLFAAPGCIGVMQAKQSLGVTGDATKFFYPGSCLAASVIKAGGPGAEGAYFNNELLPFNDVNDPEVKIYRDKLQQYGSGGGQAVYSGFSQSGFSSIINIADLITEIGPDNLTAATFLSKIKSTKDHHNFMTHPYTCDGKQTGAAPLVSVCNVFDRIVQLQSGQPVDVGGKWISGFNPTGT